MLRAGRKGDVASLNIPPENQRETVKDGIVKATWKEGRGGKKWLEEGIKAADGNWERALPRRLPSNSSSKLCAKTAFGMVHREQLCDNEP